MEEANALVSVCILLERSQFNLLDRSRLTTLFSLRYFYLLLLLDLGGGRTGGGVRGGEAPRRLGGGDPRSLLES
jgi:hypothetical protein